MVDITRKTALDDWLRRRKAVARLPLGVCIRDLHVHGFVSSTRVQPTALSYALTIPRLLSRILFHKQSGKVQILRDINGSVDSGEMLLVLGRPGSGCTTFLKALAGDTHGIFVSKESRINYEGIPYKQMHRDFKGESIYLAELDVHLPELTLGQTLTFAAATREKGSQRNSVSSNLALDVASLFDLGKAFNTWMGNSVIRGVSGGERRRTSIAEAIVGGAQLQCWDNSTRGLDSATAQRFIDLLRESTMELKTTVAMTLYQASEVMYKSFGKVTLLYQGRQIYFGPVQTAAAYFEDLGFERPSRATTPDFLTSLTNPAERVIRKGFEDRVPRTPDQFVESWRKSTLAKVMYDEMEAFDQAHPVHSQIEHADIGEKSQQNGNLRAQPSLSRATYRLSLAFNGRFEGFATTQPPRSRLLSPMQFLLSYSLASSLTCLSRQKAWTDAQSSSSSLSC